MILLLGSYDPKTKRILYTIKDEIAKLSTFYDDFILIPLLLADIEIYDLVSDIYKLAIIERFEGKYTIMLFNLRGNIIDVSDVEARTLKDIEAYMKKHFNIAEARKPSIFNKLRFLAHESHHVFIVRHEELTRCGEYIELAYLILQDLSPLKITLLIREGIPISTMLKELIRMARLYHESYQDENDLLYIIRRIIDYIINEQRRLR